MSDLNSGMATEYTFVIEAIKRGLLVSKPIGQYKYDFIVQGTRLFKVQVKSTSNTRPDRVSSFRFNLDKHFGHGKVRRYVKEDVDIFALHIVPLDVWYFIPFEKIKTKGVTLDPFRESETFNAYKDVWDIFHKDPLL